MTQSEEKIHRLMDALLKEDARGGTDELLLADVEEAIRMGEGGGEEPGERTKRSRWPLAWAALVLVSAASIVLVVSDLDKSSGLAASRNENEGPRAESQASAVGFPHSMLGEHSIFGEPSVSEQHLIRAAQIQDESDLASRCDMVIRIEDVVSETDQTPTKVSFSYQLGSTTVTKCFSTGENGFVEEEDGSLPPFHVDLVATSTSW